MPTVTALAHRALDALLTNDVRLGRGRALGIGVAALIAVGASDWATSHELSLNSFYLVVSIFVTWRLGWRWGLACVLLSVANQMALGLILGYPHSKVHYFVVSYLNRLFSAGVIVALVARLRYLHQRERDHSRIDFLTGALNYRGFSSVLAEEMARHRRSGASFSVAYFDVDNFKTVNDTRGHSTGDELLKAVVDLVTRQLRATDRLARVGGDEFAILLPATDQSAVEAIVDRLHRALAQGVEREFGVTFSVGVATFATAPETEDEVIAFADTLMYRVKGSGKNNVAYACRNGEEKRAFVAAGR